MSIYQLGVLGTPTTAFLASLTDIVTQTVSKFGLNQGVDVSIIEGASNFAPDPRLASAAMYYGGNPSDSTDYTPLTRAGVPIIPVYESGSQFSEQIPPALRHINGIELDPSGNGVIRVASALLECVGLLPRQRRVFLSYRREEAREAALQLFERLSAKQFDVFLDTHGVLPAEDFQETLWNRLCESDVLVMLDTTTYFESRWTTAEFGRALAKSVTVLRLGWPGVAKARRLAMVDSIQLACTDVRPDGKLIDEVVTAACAQVEILRSKSIAIRHMALAGALRAAMDKLGGNVVGIGQRRSVILKLPDDRIVIAYPTVGVPSAETIYETALHKLSASAALVYDHVGLHEGRLRHLAWLGEHIRMIRCVRSCEAAWTFADWVE